MEAVADITSSAALSAVGDSPDSGAAPDTGAANTETIDTGGDASGSEETPGLSGLGEDLDQLNDTGEATPETEETPAGEEGAPAEGEEPPPAETPSDLPEGVVKGKDSNGKPGLFVKPERWEQIYGHHQTIQQMSEIAGEPITLEGFQERERALQSDILLKDDLISGNPQSQTRVVQHLLSAMQEARQNGMTTGNPAVPFAQALYSELKADPEAYAALRSQAATDLLQELYDASAQGKDKYLFLSLGHVANALGMQYKPEAEMEQFFQRGGSQDPVSQLQTRIQQLESQLNGTSQQTQAAQFESWVGQTRQVVLDSILNYAVLPAVAEAQKQGIWAKNAKAFEENVVKPLHSAVNDILKKDTAFGQRIARLNEQAQTATARRRGEIQNEIARQYANRATLAAQAKAQEVLRSAATKLQSVSQQNQQRLKAGQQFKAPQNGSSVKRSLVPTNDEFPDGIASPERMIASMRGL